MKKEWDSLSSIRECTLSGIYANQINIFRYDNELSFTSSMPIIAIRNPELHKTTYWKFGWRETKSGDDILIVNEQNTPEPLQYISVNTHYQSHVIKSSSFSLNHNKINKVSVYGFVDGSNQYLTDIILELEDRYISIRAGAVIEIKITEMQPDNKGNKIFSV
ncbi:hypothetical protein GCM10008967_32180 [Bacillus carboniphilus]|uniref:Uncharacterized protein n=1 Tax=Bacillus carboniphilus TaxID=86663 RepID=A0ABN0WJ47_9BACI